MCTSVSSFQPRTTAVKRSKANSIGSSDLEHIRIPRGISFHQHEGSGVRGVGKRLTQNVNKVLHFGLNLIGLRATGTSVMRRCANGSIENRT